MKTRINKDNFLSKIPEIGEAIQDGKEYDLEIKRHREKRSLDANGYFWKLADELAVVIGIPAKEIYRSYIKDIAGVSVVGCYQDEDVPDICRLWEKKGLGWQTETFPSRIQGCTNVIFYKGSSDYDTAQMSRLINLLVEDCKIQGIQTDSPRKIDEIIERWGKNA